MDRAYFYKLMAGSGDLDYEVYLNTPRILSAQKDYDAFCNRDELQFQIVHQVEELWMKLLAYTLLDIDEYLQARHTNRVLTLFGRVHRILRLMTEQLGLLKMPKPLWGSFVARYLEPDGLTVEAIYDSAYDHGDAYMVAEALAEFDELFQKFRYHHIQLIHRTIGMEAKSLKGRSVELLKDGLRTRFFPELWRIRSEMTDAWGGQYGVVRDSISGH